MRRKILPAFEPLSESTESESDESKKNSPVEEKKKVEEGMQSVNPEEGRAGEKNTARGKEEEVERREELRTPGPVDIVGSEEFEEGEISSSSEIEVLLRKLLLMLFLQLPLLMLMLLLRFILILLLMLLFRLVRAAAAAKWKLSLRGAERERDFYLKSRQCTCSKQYVYSKQ